jgi:Domain of unknown function (DUF1843)
MADSYGSRPRPLYGVWIDEALQSNDPAQMKAVLTEARKLFPAGGGGRGGPIVPLYAVYIHQCIEQGASREDLQGLLEQAKAVKSSDLDSAIKKLETHLGSKK